MKPLADIIRAGFAFYSPDYTAELPQGHSRYLCIAIGLAYKKGLITISERDFAHKEITNRIKPNQTLRNYFRDQKGIRFPTVDDSYAYWNQWLNELENDNV